MSFLDDLLASDQAEAAEDIPSIAGGALLAVDIGNVHTRAALFDVVDGQFRFVARGEAPTTSGPPFMDIFEGVRRAIQEISAATGRQLLDQKAQLILPERGEFLGVSACVVTASAGKPIRAVLVGLVPEVSLASGQRAAQSTYLQIVDTFSLGDRRSVEQKIDAMLRAEPDLILIVGGTDGGAVDSLRKEVELLGLTVLLMERHFRPIVLYAGNRELQEEIQEKLGNQIGMRVLAAENVRPTLEVERLESAQTQLAALFHAQKSNSTRGFADIGGWTNDGIFPTAHGFSRAVRMLAELLGEDVLGIDLGSASTAVAATVRGHHYLNVFGDLGMGHSARQLLDLARPDMLGRWLTFEPRRADEVADYILNKTLYPHSVPADPFELEIEYAMAREMIRRAVLGARATWRDVRRRGLLPPFGTILLSGSTLTRAPHDGWAALVALDALLPVGLTRLLIDPYGLAPALGTLGPTHPAAVIQVLDTGAFIDLGTVVSISGRARKGEIVLRGSLKVEGSTRPEVFEVAYGSIVTIPLERGTHAELTLQPRRVDIETAQRRSRRLTITGGELGLIVDARGRPWRFPRNQEERRAMLSEWQKSITGEVLG